MLYALAPDAAFAVAPAGSEFQVNTHTTERQRLPRVASDSAGNFVVVWHSYGHSGNDTSGYSIQGQRFDASGAPVGTEFQVNSYTTGWQQSPSVASSSAGQFVVVWYSYGSADGDTDGPSIQGQRYDASGSPVGGQFQVNTYTTGYQRSPSVTSDAAGGFVVVWDSSAGGAIQARRYDASGAPIGGQFQVDAYTTNGGGSPSVASDAAGGFVVAWTGAGPGNDTSSSAVQGRRYAASGAPLGGPFQVNTYTTNSQSNPQVACDAGGGFVVVWMSDGSASGDTDGSIHGQRYDASGAPVGSEFQVNTYTTNSQELPSIASDSAGDFVVVWDGFGSPGSDTSPPAPLVTSSVQGRAFEANGSPIGDQFQVNTYTTGNQFFASVAANSGGTQFAVVWQSDGSTGTDTDAESVQGQRYLPELSLPGSLAAAFAVMSALARRRA